MEGVHDTLCKMRGRITDTARLDWLEWQGDKGACPGVINDDSGRWAVSFEGVQNVPCSRKPIDIATSFFIKRSKWKATIRQAIDAAMRGRKR